MTITKDSRKFEADRQAMTTPTQAQIEAAARAMEQEMFAPHELPLDDELHGKYLHTAKAALAAAAGIIPKQSYVSTYINPLTGLPDRRRNQGIEGSAMTQPTQAQIEAAEAGLSLMDECVGFTKRTRERIVRIALTAATEVGKCKKCGGLGYLVGDAEWEPYAVQCPDCAAAADGEPRPPGNITDRMLAECLDREATTIKRCAQVADGYAKKLKGNDILIAEWIRDAIISLK